jgi:hypothetical protein
MRSVKEVLSTKKEIGNISTKYLSSKDVKERVMLIGEGLVSEQWVGWYCKAYKLIGEQAYTKIAHMARQGRDPRTLFGWLLKDEMRKYI